MWRKVLNLSLLKCTDMRDVIAKKRFVCNLYSRDERVGGGGGGNIKTAICLIRFDDSFVVIF